MKKGLLIMTAVVAALLAGCTKESVSLGVIGGADGPTAIFVSAAPFWWAQPLILAAVIAAVVIAVVRRKKRR